MKSASEPMTLGDVETLLVEASRISNHRRFVIGGSLAATGALVHPPSDMVMSRDLDFYPQLDPERDCAEISRQLGEGSVFHGRNGFYADPISPKVVALPGGWETRLAPISLAGGVVAFFVDPNDIAISKMVRGSENDMRWVRAGLAEGNVTQSVSWSSNCEKPLSWPGKKPLSQPTFSRASRARQPVWAPHRSRLTSIWKASAGCSAKPT